MIQKNEYVCLACGKLAEILEETEDHIWICCECMRKYFNPEPEIEDKK